MTALRWISYNSGEESQGWVTGRGRGTTACLAVKRPCFCDFVGSIPRLVMPAIRIFPLVFQNASPAPSAP